MALSKTVDTDILIIGAGPTGLFLANLLSQMRLDVTVIEKNLSTVSEPRAISIDDEALRALQQVGLVDEISKTITRGYGSIYKGPNGKAFAISNPSSKEFGFEKRNAFHQPQFECLLAKALERHAKTELMFGVELIAFNQNTNLVTAKCRLKNGTFFTIQAKFLVACDGGKSFVRKSLDIPMFGETFAEPWLIVDLKSTKNRNFHTEVFCNSERPFITLPGPNGTRRYEFRIRQKESKNKVKTEEFVRKLLKETGPDSEEPIIRILIYTFHARLAKQWRKGRIFLAGDAAHLSPPFAGQGMNSGLRDVHNLAWKLDEAMSMKHSDLLLNSYEEERKQHAHEMIKLAIKMGRIMMPRSKVYGFFVRNIFRLANCFPPTREFLIQMKYKPKPRFYNGMIWADDFASRKTIVGRMIPQPEIECPRGVVTLLDEVLKDRPCVLIFSDRPDEQVSSYEVEEFKNRGASVVGLTPENIKPQNAKFPIYRDKSQLLAKYPYKDYKDHIILVRRDKYVAAVTPLGSAESLFTPLESIRSLDGSN